MGVWCRLAHADTFARAFFSARRLALVRGVLRQRQEERGRTVQRHATFAQVWVAAVFAAAGAAAVPRGCLDFWLENKLPGNRLPRILPTD